MSKQSFLYLCMVIQQLIHKSFSFIMALLVLFSTVSFTVEKHFCGDILIDASVFSEVQKCAMEAFELEQEAITKVPCCKDVVDLIKGQDELNLKSFNDFELNQQQLVSALIHSYVQLFDDLKFQIVPHQDYSPPNLVYDILVLDQVFII